MHNTLHTFLPHTYTHDQQQQLGDGNSNSGSDDSDDSGNDSRVAGSFCNGFLWQHSAMAKQKHWQQSRVSLVGLSTAAIADKAASRWIFASSDGQPCHLQRLWHLPAVSASSAAAANGSSCVQSVCCVSAASHVKLTS